MDKETLEALEGSIAKWESIVAGTGGDEGIDNCPLCDMFLDQQDDEGQENCFGCPVANAALNSGCCGTPYVGWRDAVNEDTTDIGFPFMANTEEKIAAAQRELDFLKSLRPDSDVDPSQFIKD